MNIIHGNDFRIEKPTAVTIGKFEAIHAGHQILLHHTEHYRKKGYSPLLFTFDIHPEKQLKSSDIKLIYSNDEKKMLLSEYSMDYLIEYPFTDELINMSPRQFFEDILIKKLNAKVVIVGEEFRFGHDRSGDVSTLEMLADEYNIKVDVVSRRCIDSEKISSSNIRNVILEGNMEKACEMLGRPYFIYGEIVHGRQLGRTIDMPTINVNVDKDKVLPPNGVYSALVTVDNVHYKAVANIGTKPTVADENIISIEAYIFYFNQDIYGKKARIDLIHFQREEKKFESLDALKEQMQHDKKEALLWLESREGHE